MVDPTNSDGEESESSSSQKFDVETVRKQLESRLGLSSSSSSSTSPSSKDDNDDVDDSSSSSSITANNNFSLKAFLASKDTTKLPPPPPLSSIERDRRVAEIQLLKRLEEGDDASADLWNLWYSERGLTAQTLLHKSCELMAMANTKSWKECEQTLTSLIEEYGIYFVEPVNRLATLYYLQGRFQDSYKLCQVVIQVKPWHFGALSGIVQVCIGMGDRNAARAWAERRLPTMAAGTSVPPFAVIDDDDGPDGPVNRRRTEWVEKAVANAKDRLKASETNTQTTFFGKPEDYYSRQANSNKGVLDKDGGDGDAWQ
jgi:hypothetical protein